MVIRCPSNVAPLTELDILFLFPRMRADEQDQLDAFYDFADEREARRFFLNKTGPAFTLFDEGRMPVVCGGWESVAEGVMQSWMICREDAFERHWRSITKASRWLMDELLARGVRRLQTNALASRTAACQWYVDGLKMRQEGVWRKFGRGGEDVACFARVAEDKTDG
jgi:hypothetical protein